jgi:glucosamine-6-phosphate deaminase
VDRIGIVIGEDADEVARGAAADVAEVIGGRRRTTVVFAVGESPTALYGDLAERRRTGELDTSGVWAIQLDEYLGVAPDDDRAFFRWLERDVVGPLAIPAERTIPLRGDAANVEVECERYELAVRSAGGIDLAILGLGSNGHLGFNEPPSGPDAPTRVVDLAEATIQSNARYWGGRERVPRRAVTAGMRVILSAKRTILVVTGAGKRAILKRTLEGPITPDVPASHLRTIDGVRIYADRAAGAGLTERGA